MKVFISSDMEGTAGVVDWSQCLAGQPEYDYYRFLLQAEVNAAIEGAQAAGAEEFVVNDSHSKMQNLRPDTLAGNARYISGRHKPMYMMQGLDALVRRGLLRLVPRLDVDLLAALAHLQPPRDRGGPAERDRGRRVRHQRPGGAGVRRPRRAGHRRRRHRGRGRGRQPGHPDGRGEDGDLAVRRRQPAPGHRPRADPRAGTGRDRRAGDARPPQIELPATLDITFRNADLAEMATWITGVERTGTTEASTTDDDPVRLYRRFINVVLLTRDIAE